MLVGYYHANELKADDRFGKNAGKIADAVANGGAKSCRVRVQGLGVRVYGSGFRVKGTA
jgi:hypothetical protein